MAHLGPTLRRTRRREHPAWRALLALAISAALNVLVLTQLDAGWLGVGQLPERREVTMAPLAAADWEANRAIHPKADTRPRAPPFLVPAPAEAPGQVVDLGNQPISDRPPPRPTRYVSEHDRVVEKETRARVTGPSVRRVEPTPVAALLDGEKGSSDRSAPGAPGPKGRQVARASVPDAAPRAETPPPAPGEQAAARPEAPGTQGAGDGGEQRRGDPRLAIPPQTLARLAGLAAPDHLEGVEEGDGTFLNTRSWKYASYFNRIKESVGTTWNPRRVLDQRDPDRTIYAFKDRYTLLAVTLDDQGRLKDLAVARSSNVDFLDRTAMESFRKAQPFANPPSGVVDGSGEIKFHFGFYLEMGGPGLRIYRGPAPF